MNTTPTAGSPAPSLTGDQLSEVLALLPSVDSVELKLSVADDIRYKTVASLGMDPLTAQIRQVVFFDTADLALDRHGVVLRARRVQGKDGDVVVKLRPVVPEQLPKNVRSSKTFGVELDAMPGGYVCSGTMKTPVSDAKLKKVLASTTPLRKLLSPEQVSLFEAYAPAGVRLEDLAALGPVTVLKLRFTPEGFSRRMVAELWFYPDGSRILELSTKCPPIEMFAAAAEGRAFLAAHGVDLSAPQQTKTRSALEFFSAELTAAGS